MIRPNRRPFLSEPLESRQLLSATLSVSAPLMVFNAVTSNTSQVETLTLTNTGDATLSLSGVSIVADPSQTADASARFAVTNSGSLPGTLAAGGSFNLTVDYVPTAVGLDDALLDIASSDPAAPTTAVKLRGIGTDGNGGVHQPSLMRILRAYDLPNYDKVGETDETSAYYPEPPASNSTEVDLQQMVKAGPGDVTFTILASFTGDAPTPLHIGWYQPGNVAGTMQELFHTVESDYQSVYVQPVGDTSFDPGSDVFGLYNPSQTVRVNGQLITDYTQDALNTNDTTDPRKFRFFPYVTADGVAVPNSFIMTTTEWPAPVGYDFTNIVAIISNVREAAPVATADAATATAGVAASVDVLANDTATTGTLTASSVTVTTAPASGGTATVDPTTGLITYTAPAHFHGTDTFSYTVANSAGYTSAPATVTMTVAAGVGGINAVPITVTAVSGVTTTVDELAGNSDPSGTLLPSTVTVVTAPNEGGTATVNTDGTIAYTPAATFAGTETFRYAVSDTAGATSNPTTVTVNVLSPAAAPVATDATVTTTVGVAATINIGPTTATSAGLDLATLAVANAPAHGTATVNADGTITYAPAAGFVGTDLLTYTVADVNGHASNAATVTLRTGVSIGNGAGDDRSVTFPPTGTVTSATVTLNRGTADVYFSGAGTVAIDKAGRATMTGDDLSIADVAMTDTTAASTLSITGRGTSATTLGVVTADGILGKLVAPAASLTGTASFGGIAMLQLGTLAGATITIGAGLPAGASLTLGAVTDSSLTSAVPLRLLRANKWSNAGTSAITAPSIGTLNVAGVFQPGLTLTSAGTALNAATITGDVGPGGWSVAGVVRSLSVRGSLSGTYTLGSAKTIRVTGNIADATLTFTGAGTSLATLAVTGSVTHSSITTAGSVGSIAAALLTGDTILIGGPAGTTFAAVTIATLGSATLATLRLTSRSGTAFSDTTVIAHALGSATLGAVATNNGGVADGLAVATAKSVAGTANGTAFRLSHLAATQVFGDFQIKVPTV